MTNHSGAPQAGSPEGNGSYIPTELALPDSISAVFVPLIVSTLLLGLLANSLAVFITARCSSERRARAGNGAGGGRLSVPAIYVRALLVTDTCAVVFFMIRGGCARLYSDLPISCDIDMASNLFFSWTSGLVNMLMTCDRCFALGAPFAYHVHATRGRAFAALVIAVCLSLLLSLLPVLGFGTYRVVVHGQHYCLAPGDLQVGDVRFNFSFNALFFAVGLGILVIIYAANSVVLRQIVRLRRSLVVVVVANEETTEKEGGGTAGAGAGPTGDKGDAARPQGPRSRPDNGRKEMHFGAIIIIFSVIFTLSWLPFYTQRLTVAIHGPQSHLSVSVTVYLLILNHVIDPFVYVLMKAQYRRKLVEIGHSLCCRCGPRGPKAMLARDRDRSRAPSDTRSRRPSIGTASSTLTTSLWVELGHQTSGQTDGAPTIQVTAASPSLASLASKQDQLGTSMEVINCE